MVHKFVDHNFVYRGLWDECQRGRGVYEGRNRGGVQRVTSRMSQSFSRV